MKIKKLTLTGEPALFADRGFTSHEYLEDFKLYNMNGRLYDPVVGRFLNADPVIQDAGFTQNYNRYSYCLNNPLKYSDPSGYVLRKSWMQGSEESWMTNFGDAGYPDWGRAIGGSVSYGGRGSLTPHLDRARALSKKQEAGRNAAIKNAVSNTTWVTLGFFYYDENGKPITKNDNSGEFWIYEATEYEINEGQNTASFAEWLNQESNTIGFIGVAVDATKVLLTNTKAGSNLAYKIAYNSLLVKGAKSLKPISYGLTGLGFMGDIYLSNTINPSTGKPYQSWEETGANTIVTAAAVSVGGWFGVIIQLNYMATKAYLKTSSEHPEWVLTYPRSYYH